MCGDRGEAKWNYRLGLKFWNRPPPKSESSCFTATSFCFLVQLRTFATLVGSPTVVDPSSKVCVLIERVCIGA